jgi:chromosome segregation ATPase
MEDMQ